MLASYALQQTWRIFLVLHCQFNYHIIQNFSLTHDLSSSWNGSCGGLSWTLLLYILWVSQLWTRLNPAIFEVKRYGEISLLKDTVATNFIYKFIGSCLKNKNIIKIKG